MEPQIAEARQEASQTKPWHGHMRTGQATHLLALALARLALARPSKRLCDGESRTWATPSGR